MKLEDQVCSLELAKKLKKFGVKQESLFYWIKYEGYDAYLQSSKEPRSSVWCEGTEVVSAFTVAELGEMYPKSSYAPSYPQNNGKWAVSWFDDARFEEVTEADTRAKMLIYLLENRLVSI